MKAGIHGGRSLRDVSVDFARSLFQPLDYPIWAIFHDGKYWCLNNRTRQCLVDAQDKTQHTIYVLLKVLPACALPDKFVKALDTFRQRVQDPGRCANIRR